MSYIASRKSAAPSISIDSKKKKLLSLSKATNAYGKSIAEKSQSGLNATPYHHLAKKKTKHTIDKEMERMSRTKTMEPGEMWVDKDRSIKRRDDIEIDRLNRFGLDGSINARFRHASIDQLHLHKDLVEDFRND